MKQICCFHWAAKAKRFSASWALCPWPGALRLDTTRGSAHGWCQRGGRGAAAPPLCPTPWPPSCPSHSKM